MIDLHKARNQEIQNYCKMAMSLTIKCETKVTADLFCGTLVSVMCRWCSTHGKGRDSW